MKRAVRVAALVRGGTIASAVPGVAAATQEGVQAFQAAILVSVV